MLDILPEVQLKYIDCSTHAYPFSLHVIYESFAFVLRSFNTRATILQNTYSCLFFMPVFHNIPCREINAMWFSLSTNNQLQISRSDYTIFNTHDIELTWSAILRRDKKSLFNWVVGSSGIVTSASSAEYISVRQFSDLITKLIVFFRLAHQVFHAHRIFGTIACPFVPMVRPNTQSKFSFIF